MKYETNQIVDFYFHHKFMTTELIINDGVDCNLEISNDAGNNLVISNSISNSIINDNTNNCCKRIVQRDSIEEHKLFLKIALIISEFSKCASKQVGCIVVKDRRIISSGCNGTAPGFCNCCELFDSSRMSDAEYRKLHHSFSNSVECHAEQNAMLMALRHGVQIDGCIFYVSMKPCEQCMKMIAQLNVKNIYYYKDYDMLVKYSEETQNMIDNLGIKITKLEI